MGLQAASVGANIMGSAYTYAVPRAGEVDVSLNPGELDQYQDPELAKEKYNRALEVYVVVFWVGFPCLLVWMEVDALIFFGLFLYLDHLQLWEGDWGQSFQFSQPFSTPDLEAYVPRVFLSFFGHAKQRGNFAFCRSLI